LRDADIAATREELERLREKATADIAAERDRALADLRAQVADLALAAAGKVVVGETMTDARQRRLVEEFLAGTRHRRGAEELMPRIGAGRRYAEAAFELAGARRHDRRLAARPGPVPPGWPATSGLPGPWTARPCRSASAPAVEELLGKRVSRGALNLALLLAKRGRFAVLPT
jgi:hypothetical protein